MVCHTNEPFPGVKTAALHSQLKFYNLRPEIPASTSDILRSVMTSCWELDPERRPNMEDIVNMILQAEE